MTSLFRSIQESQRHTITVIVLLTLQFVSFAQDGFWQKSDSISRRRVKSILAVESTSSVSSIIGLNAIWYSTIPQSKFHTFDDSKEWLQMDKAGHFMTTYYVGLASLESYKWAGITNKKHLALGGLFGWAYLNAFEFLDGKSAAWGFSWTDIAANSLGAGALVSQELLWNEQRVKFTFSSHKTEFAQLRPNMLGSNRLEQLLKDYNGQTYWASINIASFLTKESKFPKLLNLALGYGAEEMISGTEDADFCINNPICDNLHRYRQFYLSLDLDLTKHQWKRKFFKSLFGTIGFVKIPGPTLEFSSRGVKPYLFYY